MENKALDYAFDGSVTLQDELEQTGFDGLKDLLLKKIPGQLIVYRDELYRVLDVVGYREVVGTSLFDDVVIDRYESGIKIVMAADGENNITDIKIEYIKISNHYINETYDQIFKKFNIRIPNVTLQDKLNQTGFDGLKDLLLKEMPGQLIVYRNALYRVLDVVGYREVVGSNWIDGIELDEYELGIKVVMAAIGENRLTDIKIEYIKIRNHYINETYDQIFKKFDIRIPSGINNLISC